MKPILFSLGPIHIYSFGVMVAAGVFFSLNLMTKRARRDGFPAEQQVSDFVFITLFAGFAGSRLHYALQNFNEYWQHPLEIFRLWEGGLIFYGGVAGSMLALTLFMRSQKIPLLKGFDFLFPYLALTHAFGRAGCFLNGCCYGRACHLPWAVKFPELPVPVHPTQLYESALDLCLFLFLNARYNRKGFDGEITALYFSLYALIRFTVEIFRADNPGWLFLTYNQWISLALFAAGILLYFFARRRNLPPASY